MRGAHAPGAYAAPSVPHPRHDQLWRHDLHMARSTSHRANAHDRTALQARAGCTVPAGIGGLLQSKVGTSLCERNRFPSCIRFFLCPLAIFPVCRCCQ